MMKRIACALRGRGGSSGEKDSWHHRLEVGGDDVANSITSVQKDSMFIEFTKDMGKVYKIRKLTPRECFRLMDVRDEDIDKIQASGVSESQQYKMAGNSIVVAVLEGIFTQMFRKDSDALF